MSQSYPENPRGIRQRFSRWNTTRRGTKTLKAAYAQAARDVKRMDPAVREQIGRANMTRADLQMLAGTHVDAQFRPDRYGAVSQQLGEAMSARTSTPAQTRNPLRRIANRYSRWRNTRQGTKMLKAAFTQAARDVKRTDPAVRYAIGRSTINRSDLAALASGRMDEVFRPQGRFQNVPAQQQGPQVQGQQVQGQQVQGQQVQGQQPTAAAQQLNDRMTQQIQTLQETIEQQSRVISAMQQNLQAQAQLQGLLETRIQQLQQQVADQGQGQTGPELDQQPERQPINDNVQFMTPIAGPEAENPRALGENGGDQSPDENAAPALGEGETTPAVGEGETAPAVGEGDAPGVGEGADGQTVGDEPAVDTSGEVETSDQAAGEGPQVGGAEPAQPSMADRWMTALDENAVADEQLTFDDLEAEGAATPTVTPEATAEAAATDPQAPTVDTPQPPQTQQPQQPQVTGQATAQQPQVTGQPQAAGQQPQVSGQPGATGQQPQAAGQQPQVSGQPGATGQQPQAAGQQPQVSGQPGATGQQPQAAGQRPEVSGQPGAANDVAALARLQNAQPPLSSVKSGDVKTAVEGGTKSGTGAHHDTQKQSPNRDGR
ncbi:hypothetical protein ACQHIV_38990 [Kribbella sp. GL6]|uniref:hypothetical protein n=1 Tax=Kribbella sp. GL6 TaxID=3419765 RepID=UPI003D0254BE